jgi:predicted GH43/DUF377 family glycosyl hydrolase
MLQWNKLGKIFDPQEHATPSWMHSFAQSPCLIEHGDFVRVYFSCRPQPDTSGQYISYCGYVDLDKNNIFKILRISEKPILELGGLGMFDEFGTYPVSVIAYKSQYFAYYGGWSRCVSVPFNVAIGCAISQDGGVTFKKVGKGPIISYSPNEPFVISSPKIRRFNDKWYLFYISGSKWILDNNKPEPVYKIRCAISQDGLDWQKMNHNLIESRIEEDEAQASPDVFFYNGKYHLFFCYRYSKNFRNTSFGYRIGYAYSTDLINWYRQDDKVGISISNFGWDSEMVSYPHIFELNGKIYMMYLGNGVGKTGFGIAELINKDIL